MRVPADAEQIIEKLNEHGFEAYVVGGCVRDSLLGKEPEDWDITTSAKPEEVKAIFSRTIDTGIQHGTVTVMLNRQGYEVTTYRVDGEYEDGRHPKSVDFTTSITFESIHALICAAPVYHLRCRLSAADTRIGKFLLLKWHTA